MGPSRTELSAAVQPKIVCSSKRRCIQRRSRTSQYRCPCRSGTWSVSRVGTLPSCFSSALGFASTAARWRIRVGIPRRPLAGFCFRLCFCFSRVSCVVYPFPPPKTPKSVCCFRFVLRVGCFMFGWALKSHGDAMNKTFVMSVETKTDTCIVEFDFGKYVRTPILARGQRKHLLNGRPSS